MTTRGTFVWYELATTDLPGAQGFYGDVIGWNARDSGMQGMTYMLMEAGGLRVAGAFEPPPNVRPTDSKPSWMGYVAVPDVDACTADAQGLGASVHAPPTDIPGVGRFSMILDPQGAVIVPFRGEGAAPELPPGTKFGSTPGHGGWHELMALDWEQAFAFYAALFGWTRGEAMDIGAMGTYQLFENDGVTIGGMMTAPPDCPPTWHYYFTVADIDGAAVRVRGGGGKVLRGPHPVPGGSRIVHALDPQGAFFALTTPGR